jgi:sigma-B regulation protein RsbU (phosphoserine phosphatase)
MKFRTTLLLSMVLLIAGILIATVGGVTAVLQRAAHRAVAEDLERSHKVFEELVNYQKSLHRSEGRVVAEEPRLKAVVATEEVTPETVFSVAVELRKAIQSELFLMTDAKARILADVNDPNATGFWMGDQPLVAGALKDGEASGILTHSTSAFEVEARRLAFGDTTVGALLIGYRIDQRFTDTVQRQTGSSVVIELNGAPIAMSTAAEMDQRGRDAIVMALADVPTDTREIAEFTVDETHYLALVASFQGSAPHQKLRYALLRSLDTALAPARRATRIISAIACAALAAAILLTIVLSRRLSRPIDGLVALTRAIASGQLDQRAPLVGPIEVRALGGAMNRMIEELKESRQQTAAKERLEKELEIGAKIQTCILPTEFRLDGLEVSAAMIPASEVGGDYYDVFPVRGGGWIGIGDVAGHGLTSGLIMLMVQSTVAALGRQEPDAPPRAIVGVVNEVLYDNIRHRLRNDEHVTMSLLRFHRDGRFIFAGAHEEIIVCRKATGRCELHPTPGPWLGAIRDVGPVAVDSEIQLEDGDLMVLYSDGITEARNKSGSMFGIERLADLIEAERAGTVEQIRDRALAKIAEWTAIQEDDITLLVLRYHA